MLVSFVVYVVVICVGYLVNYSGGKMSEVVLNGWVKVCYCIFSFDNEFIEVFEWGLFNCKVQT